MITTPADELHKALAVTHGIAKGADKLSPTLRHVQVTTGPDGIIARATDRFQMATTRARTHEQLAEHSTFLLTVDAANLILPILKSEKTAPVTIELHEGSISVDTASSGRTIIATAESGVSFPDITKFEFTPTSGATAEHGISLSPSLITTVANLKRFDKSEPVIFTTEGENKPVRWAFSDWAVGLIMPQRLHVGTGTSWRDQYHWATA